MIGCIFLIIGGGLGIALLIFGFFGVLWGIYSNLTDIIIGLIILIIGAFLLAISIKFFVDSSNAENEDEKTEKNIEEEKDKYKYGQV